MQYSVTLINKHRSSKRSCEQSLINSSRDKLGVLSLPKTRFTITYIHIHSSTRIDTQIYRF